jgi:HK97 family phage portal protein
MEKPEQKEEKIEKTASIRGLEDEYVPHAGLWGIDKNLFTSEEGVTIDTLYDVVKNSPELSACMLAQVQDIIADGWRYIGKPTAITKAEKFALEANYLAAATDALFDAVMTGNGYILKLSVNEDKIKNIITTLTKKLAKRFKVKIKKENLHEFVDQQLKIPKDLQVLKASTMRINFDETGKIASYEQRVQGKKRIYKPKDIIHLTSVKVGGQPYGFSEAEPALADIATLLFAKQFVGKYFENDGMPAFLFLMEEEKPDSPNYKKLVQELKNLKNKKERYKGLALTGKIKYDMINKFNKDMEFGNLIQHFTQVVFMALGVPAHRVNYVLGGRETPSQNIGKIETGYYKKIAFLQKHYENILNRDLWSLFHVTKQFKRAYKIDEMREAAIIQILTQSGAITLEEARERIGMDPEIPKGTLPKPVGDDARKPVSEGEDKKRDEGRDQEMRDTTDNRLKMKAFEPALEVGFEHFVMIVEAQAGPGNFTKGRVFYYETDEGFVLLYSDGSWKYRTKIDKKTLDDVEKFRAEYLFGAIKLFI